MYCRHALTSERIVRGVAAAITFVATAACADPSAPSRTPSPNEIIIIGGRPIVFNALLRAIGNPDEKPSTAVEGHLQLKVYETDEGLISSWRAVIVNPECESAVLLGGAIYFLQDPEDFPNPETEGLHDLFPPQTTLGCGENVIEGVAPILEGIAARITDAPEDYTVVFFLEGGGALAGTLNAGAPPTSPTR